MTTEKTNPLYLEDIHGPLTVSAGQEKAGGLAQPESVLTDDDCDALQDEFDCYGHVDSPRIHDLLRGAEERILAKLAEKLRQAQGGEAVAWIHDKGTENVSYSYSNEFLVHMRECPRLYAAHLALLSPPLQADACKVPQGWKLVPVEILDRFPEINPSNYDHVDACALNAWGVEVVLSAAPTQVETQETCIRCNGTGLYTAFSAQGGALPDTDCDLCAAPSTPPIEPGQKEGS